MPLCLSFLTFQSLIPVCPRLPKEAPVHSSVIPCLPLHTPTVGEPGTTKRHRDPGRFFSPTDRVSLGRQENAFSRGFEQFLPPKTAQNLWTNKTAWIYEAFSRPRRAISVPMPQLWLAQSPTHPHTHLEASAGLAISWRWGWGRGWVDTFLLCGAGRRSTHPPPPPPGFGKPERCLQAGVRVG